MLVGGAPLHARAALHHRELRRAAAQKERRNFIAGVPTLFEALLRAGLHWTRLDLSLPHGRILRRRLPLRGAEAQRFDDFSARRTMLRMQMREGYGTTECVTASCLTPAATIARDGSIGIPVPGYVLQDRQARHRRRRSPYGEEGEICLAGPTVMLGYVDNPRGDGPDPAAACRRPDLAPHRRPGHAWMPTASSTSASASSAMIITSRLQCLPHLSWKTFIDGQRKGPCCPASSA